MKQYFLPLRGLLLGVVAIYLLAACRSGGFSEGEITPSLEDISQEAKECTKVPAMATLVWKSSEQAALSLPSETPPSILPSETQVTQTPTPNIDDFSIQAKEWLSPHQQYTARLVEALPISPGGSVFAEQYYISLKVINLTTADEWVLLDEWRPFGLGMEEPEVVRWSEDDRSLFFIDVIIPDGCAPKIYKNLRRADVEAQWIEQMPVDTPWVSPDGNSLLFVAQDGLGLYSLLTQEVMNIPLSPAEGLDWLNLAWSSSGDKALIVTAGDPCGGLEGITSSIFLVNLPLRESRALREAVPGWYRVVSYPIEEYAILKDSEGKIAWFNLLQGRLVSEPPQDIMRAEMALNAFFLSLEARSYDEAAMWYGGDYTVLQENNPDLENADEGDLWQRACEQNGFVCLPLQEVLLQNVTPSGEYVFAVRFRQKDGSTFVLGPCCGADVSEMPPRDTFLYRVIMDEGGYKVLDLPPYVP